MRKIKSLAVHHSASPSTTTVADIKKWHEKREWPHIAYHYVILNNGKVVHTLRDAQEGFGVYGKNKDSLHICVIGDFTKSPVLQKQIDSLEKTILKLCKKYKLQIWNIYGHLELALESHPTQCPGEHLMKELNLMRVRISEKLKKEKNPIPLEIQVETLPNWRSNLLQWIMEIITKLLKR